MQSLVRKGVVDDCVAQYGHLIVDECHHVSAHSFEQVVRRAKAKFVAGLSATVVRKDGHHPIIFMQCGPVRHRVDAKAQAAARPFCTTCWCVPRRFRPAAKPIPTTRVQFQELYRELVVDEDRNRSICDEVVRAVREGRSPLVLTERNEHLDCPGRAAFAGDPAGSRAPRRRCARRRRRRSWNGWRPSPGTTSAWSWPPEDTSARASTMRGSTPCF